MGRGSPWRGAGKEKEEETKETQNRLILGPFLTTKKVTIRDFFVVNRDFFFVAIHDKNITNHDMNFFSFSLKKSKSRFATFRRGSKYA